MIIGLTGPIGSGKGEVAKILVEDHGFIRLTYSDYLREEAMKRGIEITRRNLQDLGNQLREENGNDYLARQLAMMISEKKYYVVEGFRNPSEVSAFRKFRNFKLLGVNSSFDNRSQRIIRRGRDDDPKDVEEFKIMDGRDRGAGENESGQQGDACYKLSDAIIMNNGTFKELKKKVDDFVEAFENDNV